MSAAAHANGVATPPDDDLAGWVPCDDDDDLAEREAIELEGRGVAERTGAPTSISDVLARWAIEGPLVRQPTGIAALDVAVRGGVAYGDTWIVAGPPDAAKTAIIIQIADTWARSGVVVGVLAADPASGPDAVVTRLAQRRGYDRGRVEVRSADTLAALRDELADLSIAIYGGEITIEAAAADLAARARAAGARAGLIVDSLHAATSDRETDPRAPMRDAVAARVRSLVAIAARERIAVLATAEMSRATYGAPVDGQGDLAAGAETRVLDYAPAAKLVARRAGDGRYALEIVRSKSGGGGTTVYLALDYGRMTLLETDAPPPPPSTEERRAERERAKDDRVRQRDADDDACARQIRAEHPGASVRQLVAEIRGARGCGGERAQAAEARTRAGAAQ